MGSGGLPGMGAPLGGSHMGPTSRLPLGPSQHGGWHNRAGPGQGLPGAPSGPVQVSGHSRGATPGVRAGARLVTRGAGGLCLGIGGAEGGSDGSGSRNRPGAHREDGLEVVEQLNVLGDPGAGPADQVVLAAGEQGASGHTGPMVSRALGCTPARSRIPRPRTVSAWLQPEPPSPEEGSHNRPTTA